MGEPYSTYAYWKQFDIDDDGFDELFTVDRPIVFALANPDPEITYEEAQAARGDIIFGTGRSDYPNQVNNVLGFPFIFRGALDVQATAINEEMKLAAAHALAGAIHAGEGDCAVAPSTSSCPKRTSWWTRPDAFSVFDPAICFDRLCRSIHSYDLRCRLRRGWRCIS